MRLPPLNAVRAFEAAARLGSLALAAEELGVTHGAISKQVLLLEDHIGTRLFERKPRGVELTDSGKNLRNALVPAFRLLSSAFERYGRRPPGAKILRVATVASFAAQFLVPRLNEWRDSNPEVSIELLTSDRLIDLGREEADIAIRYGTGDWSGANAKPLCDGRLIGVSSPTLATRVTAEMAEGDTLSVPRIQTCANDEWQVWADQGARKLSGETLLMEHFVVAAEAARNGIGVVFLPELLIRDSISQGDLVAIDGFEIDWHQTFFMATPESRRQHGATDAFIKWLSAQAEQPVMVD